MRFCVCSVEMWLCWMSHFAIRRSYRTVNVCYYCCDIDHMFVVDIIEVITFYQRKDLRLLQKRRC